MSLNKSIEFSKEARELATFAKAISHPARIEILETIAKKQECICGEIVEILPIAQSTVSQHLKELKEIGLISGEIDGTKSCYCMNWEKFEEFEEMTLKFIKNLNKLKKTYKKNCC